MCPSAPLSPSMIDYNADDKEVLKNLEDMENGSLTPANVLTEVNPCTVAPWDLPEKMFFRVIWKEEKGRAKIIEKGYWQVAGENLIGFPSSSTAGGKTTWEFYMGQRPKGNKTDWVMHEYRMEEMGRFLLYRVFPRDAVVDRRKRHDADGGTLDSILMRADSGPLDSILMNMLDVEESNSNLAGSIDRPQVTGVHNQHGRSGVSSNGVRNVRLDLFRHVPHSPEDHHEDFGFSWGDDHMELEEFQLSSSSSSQNSHLWSVISNDCFDPEALLYELELEEASGDASSFNLDDGFNPEALLNDLQSRGTISDVSSSRQQHSNRSFNVPEARINSDDGFDPEALLREMQPRETTRAVSNRVQQNSNSRFNVSADRINLDDGFDSEALLRVLQPGEMTRGVSSRGQQNLNIRLNVSSSNSDEGFNPEAFLHELQQNSNSRFNASASNPGAFLREQQQNSNSRFNVSASNPEAFLHGQRQNSNSRFNVPASSAEAFLHELRSDSSRGLQNSNSRFNRADSLNLDDGFDPEALLHVLQAGEMTRRVSSWGHQNSNSRSNGSASNSYDGFNPVALLHDLQDVSSRGPQHSSSRFNDSASINSDDGFDSEALMQDLELEETSMDVSNSGQQHSNRRLNTSMPINADIGFVPEALLCRLQSGEMARGVSSQRQKHFNQRLNVSTYEDSHQTVMKPLFSGSLRTSRGSKVPVKEIISTAMRPNSIKASAPSRPMSASFKTQSNRLDADIVPSHVCGKKANPGPSIQQDRVPLRTQAGRKKSAGIIANLRKMFCCVIPN